MEQLYAGRSSANTETKTLSLKKKKKQSALVFIFAQINVFRFQCIRFSLIQCKKINSYIQGSDWRPTKKVCLPRMHPRYKRSWLKAAWVASKMLIRDYPRGLLTYFCIFRCLRLMTNIQSKMREHFGAPIISLESRAKVKKRIRYAACKGCGE